MASVVSGVMTAKGRSHNGHWLLVLWSGFGVQKGVIYLREVYAKCDGAQIGYPPDWRHH